MEQNTKRKTAQKIFFSHHLLSRHFTDGLYEKLKKANVKYDDLNNFWVKIVKNEIITDLFMVPRWQKSKGAMAEYKEAKRLGIKIHYL